MSKKNDKKKTVKFNELIKMLKIKETYNASETRENIEVKTIYKYLKS